MPLILYLVCKTDKHVCLADQALHDAAPRVDQHALDRLVVTALRVVAERVDLDLGLRKTFNCNRQSSASYSTCT